MTILVSILVTSSATMGTSNSSSVMSRTLWTMSGVYQCQNNWKKSILNHFNQLRHFLPVISCLPNRAKMAKLYFLLRRVFFSGLESWSLYQMSYLDNWWRLRQVMPIGLHRLVVDWSILLLWLLAKAGEKNSTGHFYQFGKCIWTKMISHTHCTCIFR